MTIQLQSKRHSFYEAIANTFAGMGISLAASFLIYPILGMEPTGNVWATYGAATAFFTVLSILRGFVVRRVGNKIQARSKFRRQRRLEEKLAKVNA